MVKFLITTALFFYCTLLAFPLNKVDKISLQLLSRTLEKGKSIQFTAQVYYDVKSGLMTTYFDNPLNNVVINNAKGDLKIYDVKENTVMVSSNFDNSSENSFIYFFLNKRTNDMGMSQYFKLNKTTTDKSLIITEWVPNIATQKGISKVVLVLDNSKPIYMSFYDYKGKITQKIYYGKYDMIGDISMPFQITEIIFNPKDKDSIITQRKYTNLKTNEAVPNEKINFKIPTNAKLLK